MPDRSALVGNLSGAYRTGFSGFFERTWGHVGNAVVITNKQASAGRVYSLLDDSALRDIASQLAEESVVLANDHQG